MNPIIENDLFIIIEDACKFSADRSRGTIVVEAKNRNDFAKAIGDLDSPGAKTIALGYAATHGISNPSLDGVVRPGYAVNNSGLDLDKVSGLNGMQLPSNHPDKQPAAYQALVPVIQRLI